MATLIESLTASLVIAALSGLTLLAYKHPAGYQRIAPYIIVGLSVLLALVYVYNKAIGDAYTAVTPFLVAGKNVAAEQAVFASTSSMPTLFGLYLLADTYLLFLWFLPRLLRS